MMFVHPDNVSQNVNKNLEMEGYDLKIFILCNLQY